MPRRISPAAGARHLSVPDESANAGEARSTVRFRGSLKSEPLKWQLDGPVDVQRTANVGPPRRRTDFQSVLPAKHPVRRAAGQEELPQLAPAEEIYEETSPSDGPAVEPRHIVEVDPVPPPRQFRSIVNRQPKNNKKPNDSTKAQVKCPSREELMKPIHELSVDIHPTGKLPEECPLDADAFPARCWCDSLYMWKASSLCHKPLYFEERALERYGHSWGPFTQPFVSGAHFFGTIPILPYKMGVHSPCECLYPLGYYRPGNCAPRLIYPIPISIRGAIYQAAAVAGVVYILP